MKKRHSSLFLFLFAAIAVQGQYKYPVHLAAQNPLLHPKEISSNREIMLVYDEKNSNNNDIFTRHKFMDVNSFTNGDVNTDIALETDFPVYNGAQSFGNRHLGLASGDFNGDGQVDYVAGTEGSGYEVMLRAYSAQGFGADLSVLGGVSGMDYGHLQMSSSGTQSRPAGYIKLATGDFDGNGDDEVVLLYREDLSNVLRINVFNVDNLALTSIATIQDEQMETTPYGGEQFESFDMQVTDLDFDGNAEIVIAASENTGGYKKPFVKVYDVQMAAGAATIIPRDKAYAPSVVSTSSPMPISITTGDLNGDYIFEIALAYGYMIPNNDGGDPDTYIHLFRVGDDTLNTPGNPDWLEKVVLQPEYYGTTKSVNSLATLDIDAGDMNGDGHEDLVLATGSDIQAFFISNDFQFSSQNGISTYINAEGTEYDQYLAVGDMNNDGKAEIVNARNWLYDDGEGGNPIQKFSITVHQWNSGMGSFQLIAADNQLIPVDSYGSGDGRQFALAIGDFDGDEIHFGNYNHYQVTDIVQPIIILNSHPIHSDNIGPDNWVDVNGVFSSGTDCGAYQASYSQASSTSYTVQTTVTDAWSISATVGAGYDGLVASVSASVTGSYGESYSNSGSNTRTYSEVSVHNICYDDAVYASVTTYDVYEYPLYANDTLVCYVMSIHPDTTYFTWLESKEASAFNYLPSHEVGNILSYRKVNSGSFVDDDIFSSHSFNIGQFSSDSWTVTSSTVQSSETSTTRDIGMEASVEASAFGFSLGVTGTYDMQNVSTHNISVGEDISVSVNAGPIGNNAATMAYQTTSYLSWGPSGAVTLDYEVQTDGSFYQDNYSVQDPALNLPWRLETERGLDLSDPSERYHSKSFFMSKRNPMPGDTIAVTLRVYNYSLQDTDGPVEVKFFLGNPLWGGVLQQSLDGETLFATSEYIPSQSYRLVSFDWIVPSDNTVVGRLYAQLDPNGSQAEVHEENNIGFAWLGIYFPNQSEVGIAEHLFNDKNAGVTSYPNPAAELCTFAFDLPSAQPGVIEIRNVRGELALSLAGQQFGSGHVIKTVDVGQLPAGMYTVQVIGEKEVRCGKLVVQ